MTDLSALMPITARLSALYKRDQRLRQAPAAIGGELHVLAPTEWIGKALPTRLESVTDAGTGTRYAAWVIGETLCATGGFDLMQAAFNEFSEQHGARGASWLDRRWSGIRVAGQGWDA